MWISLLVTAVLLFQDLVLNRASHYQSFSDHFFVTMTPMTPNAAGSSSSPPAETSDRSSNNRRSNNKDKKNKNKSSGLTTSSYVGKCSDIKEHVYDVSAGRSGFDVLSKRHARSVNMPPQSSRTPPNSGMQWIRTTLDLTYLPLQMTSQLMPTSCRLRFGKSHTKSSPMLPDAGHCSMDRSLPSSWASARPPSSID